MSQSASSLELSDTFVSRCPYCSRRLRIRAGTISRCPTCRGQFRWSDAGPRPDYFGLTPEDARRFEAEPTTPEGVGSVSMAVAGVLSAGICAANGGDLFACAAVGLLGGLFGGALLAVGLGSLIQRFARWQRCRSALYPDFLRYQSAVAEFKSVLSAVEAAERREHQEEQRRGEEAKRRQLEWWKKLDGRRFEKEMAALLKSRGYDVKRTGKPGDCGVDLMLKCGTGKIIVQCKAHSSCVGPGAVRDLYGTLKKQRGKEAWLISTNGFTAKAYDFASGVPIRLMTIEAVLFHGPRCDGVS